MDLVAIFAVIVIFLCVLFAPYDNYIKVWAKKIAICFKKKGTFDWEKCPKCDSISIEWRAERGCFRCLERACHYEWKEWPGGPKTYEEIKNKYLKGSLHQGEPIPYA